MEPGSVVSAVRSQRVLYGKEIQPAVIIIKEGKIHSILPDSGPSMHTAKEVRRTVRMRHTPPDGNYRCCKTCGVISHKQCSFNFQTLILNLKC